MIRKNQFFPDYQGFLVSEEKNDTSGLNSASQETFLLMPRQFRILLLIRRSTVADPEYHPLNFMHISPG